MRALVTGANGFIGEHLVNHLTSHGWEVGGVQRRGTITRLSAVYPSLDLTPEQLQGYDVIYHLAGAAHDRARSRRALQRLNVEASRNLLVAATSGCAEVCLHQLHQSAG